MGDWHELAQAVFIGLIFSFLVAKLISMVISFREENLRIVREDELPIELVELEPKSSNVEGIVDPKPTARFQATEDDPGAREDHKSPSGSFLGEDDDDWEGVESTELDEAFSAASAFVATAAADRLSQKVSNDSQLELYGLYKIATEGPCSVPQPSALKITARAKWNAWQRLGAMPPEEAMQKYIMIVCELYPSWTAGSSVFIHADHQKSKVGEGDASTSGDKRTMGPVFSTFVHEEESDNELKLDAIHASAREGDAANLIKYMENDVSVNLRDSEGRTPLHWAVDRGHLNIVELLLSRNADVNAKDNEGQTPLHYAVICERESIAEYLVKKSADRNVKDNNGDSSCDLCESTWPWMFSGVACTRGLSRVL